MVHLLYMHSILGRGSFCFNYCLNSAWHGGDQFVALLRWYGSPDFFDSGLQLICIFWSLVSHFLLTIPHRLSMFRSGEFAGQSSTPTPCSFNQLLVLLAVWAGAKSCWKMKSASLKSWSAKGSMKCSKILVNGFNDVGFQKTQWTNTSRWHCSPNHHRLWKLNTGLQQLGLWASPPFLQTLGPWFSNEIQNLLSSEKRTWDHWATVPVLLFSPGKTPLMTTVAKFLDTSVCGGSWCLDPSLSPFLVKFTQILESILLDNPHKAAVLSVSCASFLPLNFLLTCLDAALCEQPASLAMNVCGLSSLWRVSMIVFWTTVRSAVFPMIVVA